MSRGPQRIRALFGALANAVASPRLPARPADPSRILVLHELLLGDTLMLAPLLAALRLKYPGAEIFFTAKPAYAGLFDGRPYRARALPFSEADKNAQAALSPARNCDLVILPGDNRHAVLARSIGAKWIVGFAGGKPAWRDRAVDELIAFPPTPLALSDLFALLAGLDEQRAERMRYSASDWPSPACAPFDRPPEPYAVLHVGAGSPLRLWEASKWRQVAQHLAEEGVQVVWTAGPNETALVSEIDPEASYRSLAGRLDLAQLWHLLVGARLAITLDTGIAHMAKLTQTPVTVLFGQGSAGLFGKGRFWERTPFHEVTIAGFACRDQRHVFKRDVAWVRRCNRTLLECPRARCMEAIAVEQVIATLQVQ
jgi:ADP-heptose:LPS heptosyltransferase